MDFISNNWHVILGIISFFFFGRRINIKYLAKKNVQNALNYAVDSFRDGYLTKDELVGFFQRLRQDEKEAKILKEEIVDKEMERQIDLSDK